MIEAGRPYDERSPLDPHVSEALATLVIIALLCLDFAPEAAAADVLAQRRVRDLTAHASRRSRARARARGDGRRRCASAWDAYRARPMA